MLGTDLVEYFQKHTQEKVLGMGHAELDIVDAVQVRAAFERIRPDVVINAAAYTNVDGAETEREKAHAINGVGPGILSQTAKEFQCRLIHFSTDYVFNGEGKTPWKETDPVAPLHPNYYAETKLAGEKAVLSNEAGLVLRVQWLYGKKRDRFAPIKTRPSFTALTDQLGAPTWSWEIARTVSLLIEKEQKGLFHMSYDNYGSWFDVFQFVKETLHLKTELIPTLSEKLHLPAKRPKFCVLSNEKLCKALNITGMGSWKEPLKAFLSQYSQV